MTEKMGYKHSEVLSAVLTNRACHTLAVYFLLNKKMKRLSKEYRVRGSHLRCNRIEGRIFFLDGSGARIMSDLKDWCHLDLCA